jgi:RNA polymerase sporulation-specific sigma factor
MGSLTKVQHRILKEEETRELIRRAQQGDEEAKEQLVIHNVRLVRNVVKRLNKLHQDQEDLFQIGMIGLLKAIQKFDVSVGVKFSTYAVPTVNGEIRKWLRDKNELLKVPRDITLAANKIHVQELYDKTPEELVETLDIDLRVAKSALTFAKENMMSLHEPVGLDVTRGEPATLLDMLQDDVNSEWFDMIAFRAAMEVLDERERTIIDLRYRYEMHQREIAPIVGCSQVHVCRLERKAIGKLKDSFLELV